MVRGVAEEGGIACVLLLGQALLFLKLSIQFFALGAKLFGGARAGRTVVGTDARAVEAQPGKVDQAQITRDLDDADEKVPELVGVMTAELADRGVIDRPTGDKPEEVHAVVQGLLKHATAAD